MTKQFFAIPHMVIAREDLEALGFKAAAISDNDMEDIAELAGDSIMESDAYWLALEESANAAGIKRKARLLIKK